MEKMDAMILMSQYEGLPNVLIEAQSLGIPIVFTPAGGSAECCLPGETGEVLSDLELPDLHEACEKVTKLIALFKANPTLKVKAINFANSTFSIPEYDTQYSKNVNERAMLALIKKGKKTFISLSLFLIYSMLFKSCSLPRSGPTQQDIQYKSYLAGIRIIPLTTKTAQLVNEETMKKGPLLTSPTKAFEYEQLGIGDKLDITVWEAAAEGLYTGGKSISQFGKDTINGKGQIYVPYVGMIIAGNTVEQLQKNLTTMLRKKAINPQIIIKQVEGSSRRVSIQGVVAKPGTFDLTPEQHDLVTLLAAAGGSTVIPELTEVIIERKGQRTSRSLAEIFQ